jgi:hypothetical protein
MLLLPHRPLPCKSFRSPLLPGKENTKQVMGSLSKERDGRKGPCFAQPFTINLIVVESPQTQRSGVRTWNGKQEQTLIAAPALLFKFLCYRETQLCVSTFQKSFYCSATKFCGYNQTLF